ncbi:MAG TPA: aminoglycoside 6-adenylyltransferase [Anaerolineae bacterium]|nr:aminoglycoside 6-adenylyltransferase [Anaerolineae bacterium]
MKHTASEEGVIDTLIEWAEHQPGVRAVLLTSSRAVPHAPADVFSDYDVILALRDVQPLYEDRTWLEAFGPVLVVYRDPLQPYYGFPKAAYVTQYENGLKIDFTLWPVEILQRIAADAQLPDEFDAGYRVLLDKDHLTDGLRPPTYRAYIPAPPTETEYLDVVEGFFHEATYAAKYLWRDELMAVKHFLDHCMKQEHLRPMLEWRVEIDHQWSVKPGLYGRWLKKRLGPDLWAQLESTYTGAGREENWEAMFRTIDLFRKVAMEVGDRLGYAYPHDLDRRTVAYLQRVKNLDPKVESFS